jgi:hypothetical protein
LGIDAATIRLRTKLGALQKYRPSANESVRGCNAAGEHSSGRNSLAGLTAAMEGCRL